MNLSSVTDWIAWSGIVLPLVGMSWAAIQYVINEKKKFKRDRFSQLLNLLGEVEGSDLTRQVAAIYELRKYPEYKEVIGRILWKVDIHGSAAKLLIDEMDITLSHLGLSKREKNVHS